VQGLRERLGESARAFGEVFRNPDLRRLQLAWAGSLIGNWSYFVALAVYAYDQGGAAAVGLVGVIRMLPAAIASPFLASLADRYPRKLVMVVADVVRAVLMLLAALAIWQGWSQWLVYAIVGLSTVSGTVFRPAQAALLPHLARSPGELTAANVASSTLESVGAFIGPALGGVLLAFTSAETVFVVNAASFVWSALLVLAVRSGRADETAAGKAPAAAHEHGGGVGAGFRAIFASRDLVVLSGLYTAQTLVAGALNVLVVVAALELLDVGDSGVGYLNGALGVGGLVGGFVALVLASRGRLAADFGLGVALFGVPLALIGIASSVPVALLALGLVGLGNSLVDINALTIMQRTVPDEVLGRVLGVLEGVLLGSIGVGALLAPLVIEVAGIRWALVATGLLLPALALLAATRLRSIDRRSAAPAELQLLQGVPILAPLPLATLELLAGSLDEVRYPAGSVVIREGEAGDRFYVIDEGEVEIAGNRFGRGEAFGEIALLRDVPRTATVTAATDVTLYALERDEFIAAVTGHEPALAAADAVIAARFAGFGPTVSRAPA
jgi:MFS family permease